MLDLMLAVCCSLAIGMIFKHTGRQGMDRIALLTVNYLAAFSVAFLSLSLQTGAVWPGTTQASLLLLGGATGALFILGFFMLALATEVAGMSLAIGVMRVSVVLPFLASWWIWDEVPSPAQGAGLILAAAAFFMIARRGKVSPTEKSEAMPREGRVFLVLALLFLVGGAVDILMKTFDEAFAAQNSRAAFLLLVFGVAFGIGAALVGVRGWRTGAWPGRLVWGWGVVLGLVNYGSAVFFLRAIRQLSGPFVFPANNIALVIGAALLGVYVWGEQLSRLNWLGLGLATVALVLLNA